MQEHNNRQWRDERNCRIRTKIFGNDEPIVAVWSLDENTVTTSSCAGAQTNVVCEPIFADN